MLKTGNLEPLQTAQINKIEMIKLLLEICMIFLFPETLSIDSAAEFHKSVRGVTKSIAVLQHYRTASAAN